MSKVNTSNKSNETERTISRATLAKGRKQGLSDEAILARNAVRGGKFDPNKRKRLTKGDESGDEYSQAELRKIRAEATLKEMQLASEKLRLVDMRMVKELWKQKVRLVREKFQPLTDRLASKLAAEKDARKVRMILREEIHGILAQLSNAPGAVEMVRAVDP